MRLHDGLLAIDAANAIADDFDELLERGELRGGRAVIVEVPDEADAD